MASAPGSDPDLECPICNEDFEEPKILPCTHLACKKCLVSWLGQNSSDGGCPLCRAPILASKCTTKVDLAKFLDSLPTNLAVMALVDSQQVLTSSHVCAMCPNNVTATAFCMQCEVKLCPACKAYHQKLPGTKSHQLEQLSKLTAKQLAEHYRLTCKTHPDKQAELYCSKHQQMICILCASTDHESCKGKKTLSDVANDKRSELTQQVKEMRQSEQLLAKEIKAVTVKLKLMRKGVKDTFDDLQKRLEERRQEVERDLQATEDSVMASLKTKETSRAAVASNASTVEHLATTAPQAALLGMMGHLTSRLGQIQTQTANAMTTQLTVPEFVVNREQLQLMKSEICRLGDLVETSHLQSTIRVIIMGRTGSGKSSLGNSLTGQNVFKVGRALTSETFCCKWIHFQVGPDIIELIDTPGFFNTHRPPEEINREIAKSLAMASPGPHIIVWALRCDHRFTYEEYSLYTKLKELLSDDMKRFLIIVFNGMELVWRDNAAEQKVALKRELDKVSGNLQTVLQDVNNRYVGMNNNAEVSVKTQLAREVIKLMKDTVRANNNAILTTRITCGINSFIEGLIKSKQLKEKVTRFQAEQAVKQGISDGQEKEAVEKIERLWHANAHS